MLTIQDESRLDVRVLRGMFYVLTCWYWIPMLVCVGVWIVSGAVAFSMAQLRDAVIDRVFCAYVRWRPTSVPNSAYIFPDFSRRYASGGLVNPPEVPRLVGEGAHAVFPNLIDSKTRKAVKVELYGDAVIRINAIANAGAEQFPMPRGLR